MLTRAHGLLAFEEALARLLQAVSPLPSEAVPLADAHGRFIRDSLCAPFDLPAFDNSAVDGYAARIEDVAHATAEQPVLLRIIGKAPAGTQAAHALAAGTCVRIFTGSPLPEMADTVVMQEDTRSVPDQPDRILVVRGSRSWENVRVRGDDLKAGASLLNAGARISPGAMCLLAACGVETVRVARRPVLGVLATGDELHPPGRSPPPGGIYESIRFGIAVLVRAAGGIPRVFDIVSDKEAALAKSIEQALAECDGIITAGGVSVGEFDLVKAAFERMGGHLDFWRVAIKPGRPFAFGRYRDRFLFGLPGNPVSALVTFLLLVRPAILRQQSAADLSLPAQAGQLEEPLVNDAGRRHFMRVVVDEKGRVCSAGLQASHGLAAFARANGLVDVPPRTTLPKGAWVNVLRWF